MDWDRIKGFLRSGRLKVILRWAGGGLLALLAAIMFFAFIFTAAKKDMFGQRVYQMAVMDVVLMWLVILGMGAPGALLLRKAIRELKHKNDGDIDDIEEAEEEE